MADFNPDKKGLMEQALHYWNIILKWKWTAALFCLSVVVAVTAFSFLVPPVYTSRGRIWIEEAPNILPFEEIQRYDGGVNQQSHSQLLNSRTLAGEVIDKLKLYENPNFVGRANKKKPIDPADPVFRERFIAGFVEKIAVNPVRGTRLVEVTFSNRDAKTASEVLNAIFDKYIEMLVRRKYMASEQASEFLTTQIVALRDEIAEAEKNLAKMGSEKDILPLTTAETPLVNKLTDVNQALTAATLERINKLAYYNQLRAAPLGDIPEAASNPAVQRLREQYATLSREYAKRSATLQPEYPEMQRLKSELDATTEALRKEMENVIRAAYADYQTALNREQSLKRLLDDMKNEAYKANSSSILYNSLKIEIDNKKSLLEALSKRQSETDVASRLKDLQALNVWVVDKADYPVNPAFPNKTKNLLIALLVGLAGGIGLALGIEYINATVKTSKDVAAASGLPTLGAIPAFESELVPKGPKGEFARLVEILRGRGPAREAKRPGRPAEWRVQAAKAAEAAGVDNNNNEKSDRRIELIVAREPDSIQAESYRSLRTTLLVSSPPGKVKSLLVTSPLARDGKTSTLANLGLVLSQSGKKVVLVDSDLRKPKLHRMFGLHTGWGLSHFLSSFIDASEVIKSTQYPNLFVIIAGPVPANPVDLLTTEKMDSLAGFLKERFDYVLYDSPPVLAVSDAVALGPLADGVLLVARGSKTPLSAMRQARHKLEAHRLKCLGVILNGVNLVEQDGYYAKQYYRYAKPE